VGEFSRARVEKSNLRDKLTLIWPYPIVVEPNDEQLARELR